MIDWPSLLAFVLLTAGHTELWVALVNRVHSLPLPCGTLRQIRHLHDVAVPLFPVLLFAFLGFGGPKLLLGGSWRYVPLPWQVVLTICAAGTVGLFWSISRYLIQPRPESVRTERSETVDIAARLGHKPLGAGPFLSLAKLPGNEIFQVEFAEKVIVLPQLPAELDGLRILHLTDFHFIGTTDLPFFEEVCRLADELHPDVAVFTGDLLDHERYREWLNSTLGRVTAPAGRFFILGNHDVPLSPELTRQELTECGWVDVSSRVVNVPYQASSFALGGDEQPWMGGHPEFDEEPAFRVLLSHSPDNFPWAQAHGVDLMLSGHNHGGQVVLPVIGPVFSPSRYGVRYAAGAYEGHPTLMYVSRGLSARHPLRRWCRPEVAVLRLTRDA